MTRHRLPVVFMRGGTSKGLFFHERDLPTDPVLRDALLLSAMGSPDPFGRQLNGMGGGLSSLSKVIIVRPSQHPDADIEYLHGQVAVDRPEIDYSGNCGNLSAAVGPFAIDERLVPPGPDGERRLRLHNLNSGALIHARVLVRDGLFEPTGDFALPGVAGSGSRIALDYLSLGAALFPSGRPVDRLKTSRGEIEATAAIASMPCVFVRAADVGLSADQSPDSIEADEGAMSLLEEIRRAAGVLMGLATSADQVPLATPKVGIVGPPASFRALDGSLVEAAECDLLARVLSMGQPHKALPLTAAMCLAAACLAEGSLPRIAAGRPKGPEIRLGAPSGVVAVGALLGGAAENPLVEGSIVYATARRLMEGAVYGEA
jgi:2-methylaconitate cis-trans-isomerase PrpF